MSITANCQGDTLTKNQIDSLVSWVGFINTDLKDYDLLKQKSNLQDKKINSLESIQRKQIQLDARKNLKLNAFSNQIVLLDSQKRELQQRFEDERKKASKRGIENWFWRITQAIELYFIIRWATT